MLVVGVAPVGEGYNGNTAARHEDAPHFEVFGLHELYEVFHYYIHAVFVEVAVVAKAEEV